jgi:hypothetical protein
MMPILIAKLLGYWRPIAIGVLLVAALLAIYSKGRADATQAWASKEAARQLADARRRVALQDQVDQLASGLEAARAARQVVTRTITKEVPRYVTAPAQACADTGLHAPGFRVLHDAAAAGAVPDPARLADAAPVDAQPAGSTITGNYALCNEWRKQVIGWQSWYRTVNAP